MSPAAINMEASTTTADTISIAGSANGSGASTPNLPRVAIIGVGQVGGSAAYSLVLKSIPGELLLVDNKVDLRDAQVTDLQDVAYATNSSTRVRGATYHEAGQCDLIVIATGTNYYLGQTTNQATWHNIAIVRNAIMAMRPFRPDATLLIVSTPCDLLTSFALLLSKLPASQVIGSGTLLDSVRLRGLMADRIGVAAKSIHAYVLGVHGREQVVAWSCATVGGAPLDKSHDTLSPQAHTLQAIDRKELARECRQRTESVVAAKGTTHLGMAAIITNLASCILLDKRKVLPVSHFVPAYGCCVSMPAVVGRGGIVRSMEFPLDAEEARRIGESARDLKEVVDRIDLSEV